MAGLNSSLVNEHVAVAVKYLYTHESNQQKNLFVFDYGGISLKLSVITVMNKKVRLLFSSETENMAGNEID